MSVPYPGVSPQSPKSNDLTGTITPSNKSPQTKQAAAQNVPQGASTRGGAAAMNKRGPVRQNGKMGRSSFR